MRLRVLDRMGIKDPNARAVVSTEWLWAIFGTPALFYLTVFMNAVGLSPIQIGTIASVGLGCGCVFQLVAGPVTDILGRRITTTLFDVTSWVIPMFIWAVSSSFWLFLVGFILNATSNIVAVSFSLLAVEDSLESARSKVFAAVKLISLLAGLTIPLVGVSIEHWRVEPVFRILFLLGAITMLVQNVLRWHWTRETRAGLAARSSRRSQGVKQLTHAWATTLGRAVTHRGLWRVLLLFVATSMALQINIFQALYLGQQLGLSQAEVGLFPAVAALASLFCFLVIMPRITRRITDSRALTLAIAFACCGWLLFTFMPRHPSTLIWVACALLLGAGPFLMEAYRDSITLSAVHETDAATYFAAVQSIASIAIIPTGLLAGGLYAFSPRLVFILILSLYTIAFLLALPARFGDKVKTRLTNPDDLETQGRPSSDI